MSIESGDVIEELKERISKNNNEILELSIKYNQLMTIFMSVMANDQKMNTKLDSILEKIYAIKDWSISTTPSSSSSK